jgi:hypothetical protein
MHGSSSMDSNLYMEHPNRLDHAYHFCFVVFMS